MNPETPPRKPRSDCLLKNLSAEQQEEIAEFGRTNSITATRDWIVQQFKIQPGRTAVTHFLAESRMIDKRYENKGAISGLVARIESDAPLLSSEDLQHAAQRHFTETIVNDSNVSAFNQSERNAIKREELEIRRQEAQIQREEMQIERERLKLDQVKFQRSHSEYIVNTCNNPKIGAAARKKGVSYAHKVKEVDTIMFGSNESTN
jgi:hypothetical protein